MHLWGCVIPVMPVLFWQTQCQKDGSLDMGLYGDYGDVDSDVVRELSTISSTVDDIVMSGDMNTKGDYGTLKDFDYGSQLPFPSTTDPKLANDEPTTTTYVENLDFDYASEQSTSSTTDPKLAEDKQTTKAYVENVDLDNGSELLVTSKTDPKLADDKQTTTAYVESMGLESGSDPSVPSTVDPKSGSTKQTTTQDVKYLDFDYGKPAAESGDTTAKVTTPGKGEKTTTPKKAKATTVSKPKDTTTTTTYDFSNVDFSNMDYDQMAAISNAWILSLFGPPSDSATSPPTADPGAVEKKVFDATDGKSGSGSDTDSKPVDDKIGNGTVDDKSWNGTDSLQDGNGTLVDSNITTTTPYPGIDCDDEKQKPLSDLLDELRSLPNTSSAFERRCQVLIMCFKNPPPDMDFEIDTIPGNETDGSSTTVTSTTTTVTDSLPDSTTPDYGEFADFTMADCSRDTGPANASSDPDVQMRSLWASIFRLKLNFTRPLDPSLGSIAPQYSEYVSVLFNYNFPRTMQENYQKPASLWCV
ncbi:mucin-2-like isoform X2 [Paramacrobiotus metropolitanus]|uniref:mucin-2-like isoform X2 n=1 Tax=Paramacrobiotus metropolitanus TaxID=2943436 RepID=UPI0024456039|nr:mucin-2-like isoform X2 [Paramacrobiotus metropolitanus]